MKEQTVKLPEVPSKGAVLSVGLPMPSVADWRNLSVDNKTNQPLEWSTLDEAAAWLTGHTGRQWGARDVLSAAIRYPVGDNPLGASNRCTAISVALPEGHDIKHAIINAGEGRSELERLGHPVDSIRLCEVIPVYPLSWRPVALLQLDVRQLLAAGWVRFEVYRDRDGIEPDPYQFDIIKPPFVARLENAGIARHWLMELAKRCKDEQPAGLVCTDACTVDSETPEPPKKWARGIRRVAFDAAKAIVAGGDKLTADGLEKAMLNSGHVALNSDEYHLKSTGASLNEREMSAKPKTIAAWLTDLKNLLKQ